MCCVMAARSLALRDQLAAKCIKEAPFLPRSLARSMNVFKCLNDAIEESNLGCLLVYCVYSFGGKLDGRRLLNEKKQNRSSRAVSRAGNQTAVGHCLAFGCVQLKGCMGWRVKEEEEEVFGDQTSFRVSCVISSITSRCAAPPLRKKKKKKRPNTTENQCVMCVCVCVRAS